MRRVLVTGSRDWPWRATVFGQLNYQVALSPEGMIVVHGACPTGADQFAHEWCTQVWKGAPWDTPVYEEQYPADWTTHGKAAGPIRNAQMVELGASVVLAFRLNMSRGTGHTIGLAQQARIPVLTFDAFI